MYQAEMWAWKKADVIRPKATEMKVLRNVKAKTRRENKRIIRKNLQIS
jgi:pyridoxal/pyridoxine/pyridoxamine kinase